MKRGLGSRVLFAAATSSQLPEPQLSALMVRQLRLAMRPHKPVAVWKLFKLR